MSAEESIIEDCAKKGMFGTQSISYRRKTKFRKLDLLRGEGAKDLMARHRRLTGWVRAGKFDMPKVGKPASGEKQIGLIYSLKADWDHDLGFPYS